MQHGFVKGRSTITQLLETVYQMVSTIDLGEQADVAFLDFSKAFDSVSRAHLIKKLDQSGIKAPLLNWFISYLGNRLRRVVGNRWQKLGLVTSYLRSPTGFSPWTCFLCVIY